MRILKRENALKLQLHHTIADDYPQLLSIVHQQVRGGGHPDMSISGYGRTLWYEIKHATPHFESPGLQEWMVQRLEKTNRCRYIIYADLPTTVVKERRAIFVLHPKYVVGQHGKLDFSKLISVVDCFITDHNHDLLAAYLDKAQKGTVL